MEKINNYYQDENGNKWDCTKFTKKQAEDYSKSLIDCWDCYNCNNCDTCNYCIDCHNCIDCNHCSKCYNCIDCHNCNYCIDCNDCSKCYNCIDCHNCIDCNHCSKCYNCIDCHNCIDCNHCHNYTSQPQVYSTNKIGSRHRETYFYYGSVKYVKEKQIQVVCGCFRGDLKEFEDRVVKTHGNNCEYRNQYLKEIEKVKVLFKLKGIV